MAQAGDRFSGVSGMRNRGGILWEARTPAEPAGPGRVCSPQVLPSGRVGGKAQTLLDEGPVQGWAESPKGGEGRSSSLQAEEEMTAFERHLKSGVSLAFSSWGEENM